MDDPPTATPSPTPTAGMEDPNTTPTNTPFPLLMTQVHARVLPNSGANYGCSFVVTPGTTPIFTQDFPVVAFNPPTGVNIGCTPAAGPGTRPFTDMVPGTPGVACGSVPMQYPVSGTPTWQAGVGPLNTFRTAFTGQFYAPQAGEVTFMFWSDDGWVLGIGQNIAYPTTTPQQPNYVSGIFEPPPPPAPSPWPRTLLEDYQMVGRFDQGSGPAAYKTVVVSFPSAGYYPFELDYTECFPNTPLALLMGTTAGAPIPPGPSPTNTFTSTPTRTPSPSPTVTPTATPISTPPTYAISYYIQQTSASAAKLLGCNVRAKDIHGIVVLDFNRPYDFATPGSGSHIYGAKLSQISLPILLWPPPSGSSSGASLPTDSVYADVLAFASGYALGCGTEASPNPNMNLTMAIGASNSYFVDPDGEKQPNPYLTFDHGRNWAMMVAAVNDQLSWLHYGPQLRAAGAYDAEPAWSWKWDYSPTYEWAHGYSVYTDASIWHAPLYDFGSCDGCVRIQPRNSWSLYNITELQQVANLSGGLARTAALPEIYHPPLAEEWYNVRRIVAESGKWMDIAGVMTECGSSGCDFQNSASWVDNQFKCQPDHPGTPTALPCHDLPPTQGWRALHDIHNAPCTPDYLIYPLSLPLQCSPTFTSNNIPPPHIDDLTDILWQATATPGQ
jgi:hypothetical protein